MKNAARAPRHRFAWCKKSLGFFGWLPRARGKTVPISPRRVMVFRPSAILKTRINSGLQGGRK